MLLLAAGWWTSDRRRPGGEPRPEAAVWRLLDASRDGEVAAYLACFDGELRSRLASLVAQMGTAGFAAYLRGSVAELKGMAVFDVVEPGEERASLVVEYVYPNETERQTLQLRQVRGEWRIVDAETGRRRASLIPYGTPIERLE